MVLKEAEMISLYWSVLNSSSEWQPPFLLTNFSFNSSVQHCICMAKMSTRERERERERESPVWQEKTVILGRCLHLEEGL